MTTGLEEKRGSGLERYRLELKALRDKQPELTLALARQILKDGKSAAMAEKEMVKKERRTRRRVEKHIRHAEKKRSQDSTEEPALKRVKRADSTPLEGKGKVVAASAESAESTRTTHEEKGKAVEKDNSAESSAISLDSRFYALGGGVAGVMLEIVPLLMKEFADEKELHIIVGGLEKCVQAYPKPNCGSALWLVYKHLCGKDVKKLAEVAATPEKAIDFLNSHPEGKWLLTANVFRL